ncbi:MAG TPA: AMMECR1 domain-containing protein, partial [Candidatus Polarisedimenticolia bacterium]|nr:AMMECR1 domain-containing protein [Candidatus Polarisedimenticolia bacterium]
MNEILPRLRWEEERALLDLARRAVAARLESRPLPRSADPPARLLLPQGAFVSLHLGGKLRGCVGMIQAER